MCDATTEPAIQAAGRRYRRPHAKRGSTSSAAGRLYCALAFRRSCCVTRSCVLQGGSAGVGLGGAMANRTPGAEALPAAGGWYRRGHASTEATIACLYLVLQLCEPWALMLTIVSAMRPRPSLMRRFGDQVHDRHRRRRRVALMKRRRYPEPSGARDVQVAGACNLGAGPRRGAARWRGTAKKLNAKSRRLRDGP